MVDSALGLCNRLCSELETQLELLPGGGMPTNLAIDDHLLEEALRVGGHATKRATVNEALAEYIARRKRRAAVQDFGTFDFDPAYDYKRERRRR